MIYTVTLNPSIDYVVRLNELKIGITNRTISEEYYFGGKGINVSCVLAQLDVESTALGFVAGFTGEAIEKGIQNDKITTDFINLESGISRINIKIKTDDETEINGQGPDIGENELEKLYKKIDRITDGDALVIAGSVPSSMPDDIYERILKRVSGKEVRIVVDATKKLLLNSLKFKPFLIKPNLQELCEIFSTEIDSDEKVKNYAELLQEMGAKNVLVSLGKDGAILIDEFKNIHKIGVAEGEPINTVGSGDSMVAGFLAGYEKEKSYAYALKLGTACGNATAFSNALADKAKINEVLNQL